MRRANAVYGDNTRHNLRGGKPAFQYRGALINWRCLASR